MKFAHQPRRDPRPEPSCADQPRARRANDRRSRHRTAQGAKTAQATPTAASARIGSVRASNPRSPPVMTASRIRRLARLIGRSQRPDRATSFRAKRPERVLPRRRGSDGRRSPAPLSRRAKASAERPTVPVASLPARARRQVPLGLTPRATTLAAFQPPPSRKRDRRVRDKSAPAAKSGRRHRGSAWQTLVQQASLRRSRRVRRCCVERGGSARPRPRRCASPIAATTSDTTIIRLADAHGRPILSDGVPSVANGAGLCPTA